jgi:hypothetical protein
VLTDEELRIVSRKAIEEAEAAYQRRMRSHKWAAWVVNLAVVAVPVASIVTSAGGWAISSSVLGAVAFLCLYWGARFNGAMAAGKEAEADVAFYYLTHPVKVETDDAEDELMDAQDGRE